MQPQFKKTVVLLLGILACCSLCAAGPTDPDATPETGALFDRLNMLRQDYLLFGHQHTTEYGIGWQAADTQDSDVKRTTGDFPAVYGWDFFQPQQTTAGRGGTSMHAHILAAHKRGGINTICWHATNPVTGGSFYDTTAAVPALLPGGGKHETFKKDLDAIAAFLKDLRDDSGALIPIIFRPWHEHNGNWFWWGTPHHCTPEQFAALWRFTVDYLRVEKGVHNLLYAWSPGWSWEDEYFTGYPGDSYVDILGFDIYLPSLKPAVPGIRRLVERAEERGKIPALTEAGYPDGLSKCTREKPFTEDLLVPLRDDPVAKRVAWMLLWRNASEDHLWVPPPGHLFADDFRAFYQDPFTLFCNDLAAIAPASPAAVKQAGRPTPGQIAWHEMEQQMFLCLDPCTWQGREYDDHSTPLEDINPRALDTNQWCEAAKAFGARQILFVAKHTGGFCWWPTETTEYCVRNIPWKEGKGDVLGELAESCRKHGLKLGVYIYPGDDQWGAGIGSGGRTADPARQEAYNEILRRQWTEVLTRYGEISELWFDGSCIVELGDILGKYAPNAMVFQGPHATLRWPGNEAGVAPEPAWQTVSCVDAQAGVATGAHSSPDGDCWLPMEMDTTLLDHKWFWAPETDHMIKPLDKLMEIYFTSVGRGGVLLLNATPDTSGLIPESHMHRYREFGTTIRRVYENMKGETSGTNTTLEIRFDESTPVTHTVIMEDIHNGHTVRAYTIEGFVDGSWQGLATGQPIGYKRIERFNRVFVDAIRLVLNQSVGTPNILKFAAYDAAGAASVGSVTVPEECLPVQAWDEVRPSGEWQTVELDLTPAIRRPGEYQLEIRRSEGDALLETMEVMLLIAGVEAPRLITPMEQPNTWLIRRTDQVTEDEKGRTVLRMKMRCTGGGVWQGKMLITKGDG